MSEFSSADADTPAGSFAFEAQTPDGQSVSGTIDASDADQAARRLQGLRLRVLQLASAVPKRRAPLGRLDFLAFNQQLAQLTQTGMPLEHGLRLIARDLRSRRLGRAIDDIAGELERGTPIGEAFEKHRTHFPSLYSRIVEAGIRANNLPAVLLNLGRHLELVQRLRASLWRAIAYPLAVLIGLLIVLMFLSMVVIPQFESILHGVGMSLPPITAFLLYLPVWMPYVAGALLLVAVAALLLWPILRAAGKEQWVSEKVLFHVPMIGPVLRRSAIARWCNALSIGVSAGLDLPSSLEIAGDTVGSPKLRRDARLIADALAKGQPMESVAPYTRLVPAVVLAGIDLSAQNQNLGPALETFARMYQQQAEVRIATIPAVLLPLLMVLIAIVIGGVVLALFSPIIMIIQQFA